MTDERPETTDTPEDQNGGQSNPPGNGQTQLPASPERSQDDYSTGNQASKYRKNWTEADEKWEASEQEKGKKALQDELTDLTRNLNIVNKQINRAGQIHAPRYLLLDKEDYEKRIKEIIKILYGEGHGDTFFFQLLMQRYLVKDTDQQSSDADAQDQLANWFINLTKREKFFAITLSTFNGLKYSDFRQINHLVIKVFLSEDDEEPSDKYFGITDDMLAERVNAEFIFNEDENEELLKFKDDHQPAEIFGLLRRRYRDVLWDLLPILKQIVEENRNWHIRSRAAVAVAEISKVDFGKVRNQVLNLWAGNAKAYIRASTAYPIISLLAQEKHKADIRNLLTDWTSPNWVHPRDKWRYCWSVASVYKHIGSIEEDWAQEWTYQGLKSVAGFDDIRVADSVIHSLVVLSLQGQLNQVLEHLNTWVEEGSRGSSTQSTPQVRCIVAILAFVVLSEIHVGIEDDEDDETNIEIKNLFAIIQQSESVQGDYWRLAVAVGVRAFEFKLADDFFNLIQRWTDYAADSPELQNLPRNLLAEVFINVQARPRERILHRLNRWEKQTRNKQIAEMATSTKAKIKAQVLNSS